MEKLLLLLEFHQALVISLSTFIADWITGVAAALRSGRRIRSSIMRVTIGEKGIKHVQFCMIGLAFYYAGQMGTHDNIFAEIASLIVLIPAVPEILSLWENVKIVKTKIDTKPKEENKNDDK